MKSTEELLQFMNNINNQIESLIVKSNKIGMFNHIIALDNVTNKHLNSVKDITIKICNKMGMTEEEISFYATCAFFHDVGKILIPPHILQKPTALTPEEFRIMKTHTTGGYEICRLKDELRPYAKAALYHHENEDGTGYPYGKKGDEIPMEARIIKVADIYDAICSRRQYKAEMKRLDALKLVYEEVNNGKVNRIIFNYLIDVVIDEIKEETGSLSEIAQLKSMKYKNSYLSKNSNITQVIPNFSIIFRNTRENGDDRVN